MTSWISFPIHDSADYTEPNAVRTISFCQGLRQQKLDMYGNLPYQCVAIRCTRRLENLTCQKPAMPV